MDKQSKKELRSWLNTQMKAYKLATQTTTVDGIYLVNLSPYGDKKIHVRDIWGIAEALGLEVTVKDRNDEELPYERRMQYKDFIFFDVSDRREGSKYEQDDI